MLPFVLSVRVVNEVEHIGCETEAIAELFYKYTDIDCEQVLWLERNSDTQT